MSRTDTNGTKPSKVIFATAQKQSTKSTILEWRFPPPMQQHKLIGKSRAAWHTSFVIPSMQILLDAGLVIDETRPANIYITHGHSDHSLLTPVFMGRERPPNIHVPREAAKLMDDYLMAKRMLNRGGPFDEDDLSDRKTREMRGVSNGLAEGDEEEGEEEGGEEGIVGWNDIRAWNLKAVRPGEEYFLKDSATLFAKIIRCDHNVPSVGYLFYSLSQRLNPAYRGLKAPELKALKASGTVITQPHRTPLFAFMGDTTVDVVGKDPEWLKDMPVVIHECSFLHEEHVSQARKTKHTVWCELEPVIRRYPNTTWVLMHFSKRYREAEIRRFFKEMEGAPENIVVWIGDEPGEGVNGVDLDRI